MKYVSKTFSIEEGLYNRFSKICQLKNINKSAFIQSAINKFVQENTFIDDSVYYRIKNSTNNSFVKIKNIDGDFVLLSDGCRIKMDIFELMYEKVNDYETVEPDVIFKNYINIDVVKEIINNTEFYIENDDLVLNKNANKKANDDVDDENSVNIDSNRVNIVKKIKKFRSDIYSIIEKIKLGISKPEDISELEKILSKIYETYIKIEIKDKLYINIPEKYFDYIFKSLLNGVDYEVIFIEEESIIEKLSTEFKKSKSKYFFTDLDEKCSHISNTIKDIIASAINIDTNIKVEYEEPIYTITLSNKFLCQEIIDFISTSYNINKDYIVLNGV